MKMRNINLAGNRERTVTNAQPPRRKITVQSPDNSSETVKVEPGYYVTGAGGVNYVMGYPIRSDRGDVVGYTNPNVSITDPAPVTAFVDDIKDTKDAIYSQCHQRHVLISGDAQASGRSREQARAEFERSLKETKTAMDAAGRWQLETTLRLAAQLAGQSEKYLSLRADFNCLVDAGSIDPERANVIIQEKDKGIISMETCRNLLGIEDAAAEQKRIDEETAENPEPDPEPIPVDSENDETQLPA